MRVELLCRRWSYAYEPSIKLGDLEVVGWTNPALLIIAKALVPFP